MSEATGKLRRVLRTSPAVLIFALAFAGCGDGDSTAEDAALKCPSEAGSARHDQIGDTRVISGRGRDRPADLPSADLVGVVVRRSDDGVVCVTFRTAGPVRLGSSFVLITRQAATAAGAVDEQRYEIQLTAEGDVNVSRPYGEPRYPVRADVERTGPTLGAAIETLLRPGESFDWRVESSYLPEFPLGDVYVDAIPGDDGWFRFPASSEW